MRLSHRVPERVLGWACSLLPPEARARYSREWRAELAVLVGGRGAPFLYALSILPTAARLAHFHRYSFRAWRVVALPHSCALTREEYTRTFNFERRVFWALISTSVVVVSICCVLSIDPVAWLSPEFQPTVRDWLQLVTLLILVVGGMVWGYARMEGAWWWFLGAPGFVLCLVWEVWRECNAKKLRESRRRLNGGQATKR